MHRLRRFDLVVRRARFADLVEELVLPVHHHWREAALLREVGGPEVMREQLRHLVENAQVGTITLQVLPLVAGSHSALEGSFILLDFDRKASP